MKKLLVQYRKSMWKPIKAQLFFRRQKNLSVKSQCCPFSHNTYFAVSENVLICIVNDKPGLLEVKILILKIQIEKIEI